MSFETWKAGPIEQYVNFKESCQINESQFFGYETHKKAAFEIGLTVIDGEACFMLLFGIPGTGKTSFVNNVAHFLNNSFECQFSLLHAQCDELLRMITSGRATPSEVITVLENGVNQAWDNRPSIIIFDEVDSLSPEISNTDPQFALLTKWIRAYCEEKEGRTKQTYTIGATNNPNVVDFSVQRRIGVNIFFDIPSKEVVHQIIKNELGDKVPSGLGKAVVDSLKKIGAVPLASDVVKGCKQFKKRNPDIQNIKFKQMRDDLVAVIGGSSRKSVDKYYKTFDSEIKKAKLQMNYYSKQFDLKHKGVKI